MSYERKTFRCVACQRRVPYQPRSMKDEFLFRYAGEDVEASGMCEACQREIEEREAVLAARLERRGIVLSNTAFACVAYAMEG